LITEACFQSIPSIVMCVLPELFGTMFIGSIFVLLVVVYFLYKAGLSFTASIPLAFLAAFSIYWITLEDVFARVLALVLLIVLIVAGVALARWFKR